MSFTNRVPNYKLPPLSIDDPGFRPDCLPEPLNLPRRGRNDTGRRRPHYFDTDREMDNLLADLGATSASSTAPQNASFGNVTSGQPQLTRSRKAHLAPQEAQYIVPAQIKEVPSRPRHHGLRRMPAFQDNEAYGRPTRGSTFSAPLSNAVLDSDLYGTPGRPMRRPPRPYQKPILVPDRGSSLHARGSDPTHFASSSRSRYQGQARPLGPDTGVSSHPPAAASSRYQGKRQPRQIAANFSFPGRPADAPVRNLGAEIEAAQAASRQRRAEYDAREAKEHPRGRSLRRFFGLK